MKSLQPRRESKSTVERSGKDMNDKQRGFELIVKAYSDDMYRFAYWLCGDQHQAHDLVQETFLRAWRSIDKLRDAKAVKAWLFTTLRRENARLYERKRFDTTDIDEMELADGFTPEPMEAANLAQIRGHLLDLPPDYREPLVLQVLFGHSVAEIAELLELSDSAVMTRLFRARQKLMARLEDQNSRTAREVSP
ncbi:MAG: sigma-70 family RNA polymerase sigma factor [Pseudomonadota bacterium]|nr:sigma-70 family RNA polymerase sigma factor [Pseudomonadota bacterium]